MSERVLLAPANPNAYRELLALAPALAKEGASVSIVLPLGSPFAPVAEAAGVAVVATRAPPAQPARGAASRRARSVLGATTAAQLARSAIVERRLAADRDEAARVLRKARPGVVVLSDDRVLGLPLALSREAAAAGARVIVLPAAVSTHEGALQLRRGRPEFLASGRRSSWLARSLARRVPGNVLRENGLAYLFYDAATTRALLRRGWAPATPWTIGGASEGPLLLASENAAASVVEAGVDKARVAATGLPSFDELHAALANRARLRAELAARHKLDPARRWVVCAVPQLAEHGLLTWEEHWRETRYLLETISAQPVELLLSLHPKSDGARYEPVIREAGGVRAPEPLSQLLPAADLFVATFSSTVRWAQLCRIPSFVVDFYGLNYELYAGCAGTRLFRDRGEFEKAFLGFSATGRAEAPGRDCVEGYPFDGRACERIARLILRGPSR